MEFRKPLQLLNIQYPSPGQIPLNLLKIPIQSLFQATTKSIPFREQFANEASPHIIRNISYRYGKIKGKRVTEYSLNKKPVRMVYSDARDIFLEKILPPIPKKIKFPPLAAPTPVARNLRELALKYVVQEFFNFLGYHVFDEPQIVINENQILNPDVILIPKSLIPEDQLNNITHFDPSIMKSSIFIELKAFHESTYVTEKELLQAYNYAKKGEKSILITTGTIDLLDIFPFKGNFKELLEKTQEKYQILAKSVDLSLGQDSFDTRGIYRSAHGKIAKMEQYYASWGEIKFQTLQNLQDIQNFQNSTAEFAILSPEIFKEILHAQKMDHLMGLFDSIQATTLEEIMINPTLLYP